MNEQDQQDLQQCELSIEQARKLIDFGDHIRSLENNKSFQTVVLDGYLRDEAVRCTGLLADFQLTPEAKADTFEALKAISYFRRYLMTRRQISDKARGDLESNLEAMEQIRLAEAAGDDEGEG